MLPIVEQGFKNPNPAVKAQSYQAWEALIDNFALNPGNSVYNTNVLAFCSYFYVIRVRVIQFEVIELMRRAEIL